LKKNQNIVTEKNILFFVRLFFTFYTIFKIITFLFQKSFLYIYKNEWAFSDILINYSGGFVRRGLLGETLSFFSELLSNAITFNLTQKILNEVIQEHIFMNYNLVERSILLPYISFIVSLISILHISFFIVNKLRTLSSSEKLIFFFVPFGLIYFVENINYFFGRKEFLIFNLLIYLENNKQKRLFPFIIFGTTLSLIHEIFLFFLPAFWILFQQSSINGKILKSISFSYLFLLNVLLITKYSVTKSYDNFKILCDDIHTIRIALQLDNLQCWGSPRYLDPRLDDFGNQTVYLKEVFNNFQGDSSQYLWILVSFLLIYYIFIQNLLNLRGIFLLLPFSALFIFAQDYGRWIFIIFFLSFIFGDLKIKHNKILNYFTLILYGFSLLTLDIPFYLNQI